MIGLFEKRFMGSDIIAPFLYAKIPLLKHCKPYIIAKLHIALAHLTYEFSLQARGVGIARTVGLLS